jgi:hypothetical protein
MKVFVSWSGERSQDVAIELSKWIRLVIQSADVWVSTDMDRGVRWLDELGRSLDGHGIGIICVTPGNVRSPWLNFEAGALSKQLRDQGRVIPYLLDFRSTSDLQPPLGQFTASLADEDGTWSIVKTLNGQAEFPQTEENLRETFEAFWPKLKTKLDTIRTRGGPRSVSLRSERDLLDELLALVRQLHKQIGATPDSK